jgi:Rrf2 family transcriptional regulator, nitric oxide-sensitive transcriptional repressor
MISHTAEYTLRVVVFLATLRNVPATTRQIAAATRVPEGYLAKILQSLSRAKLVRSQRGLHGGSVLAKDASTLSVFDVIEAVSPMARIRECPLGLESHGTNLCPLHRRLSDASLMVEQAFRSSTIQDLIAEPTESIPLGDLGHNAVAATRAAEIVFPVETTVKLSVSARRGRK